MNNFFRGSAKFCAVVFSLLIIFNTNLFSQALNQGFNTVTFPPTGWTQTAGLWSYNAVSGFCSGTGSAQANFYGVSSGTFDLTSPTFTATGSSDSLIFQDAYASYSGEDDQLQIMYSTNSGTSYTLLVLLHGGSAGALVTAPPQTSTFTPTCVQWKYQRLALPSGTNKIRFNGISAFGNDLYIDSIYVKNLPPPPVPVLVHPANHSIDMPLVDTLTWNPSAGATAYNLQIATDSLFTSVIFSQSFAGNSVIISGFPALFTCWWRANATGAGGTSSYPVPFTFKTKGPSTTPTLLLPVNNAVNQPTSLTCKWSKTVDQTLNKPGAVHLTAYEVTNNNLQSRGGGTDQNQVVSSYWFELYTDTTQAAVIKDSTLIDTTRALTGLLNSQNYWWRAKGKNDAGYGSFSPYFKFTTVVAAPAPPTLISPPNNIVGIAPTPMLVWTNAATATNYHIQVSSDSTFGTTQFDTTTTNAVDSIQVPAGRLINNVKYYWHVSSINAGGPSAYSTKFNFTTSLVGVNQYTNGVPKIFALHNNYPNPFNPSSTIKFDIPKGAFVKLIVYNMLGQEVQTLVNSNLEGGFYTIVWDAANYPSGVYFYKITAGNFTDIKKMVLIK